LKYSIPRSASEGNELLGLYGDHPFDWVGYADDLVMAFSDIASTQKGLVNEVFKRLRLSINVSKNKNNDLQLHFFFIEDSKIEDSGPDFRPRNRGLKL